jgi:hypothetical protein
MMGPPRKSNWAGKSKAYMGSLSARKAPADVDDGKRVRGKAPIRPPLVFLFLSFSALFLLPSSPSYSLDPPSLLPLLHFILSPSLYSTMSSPNAICTPTIQCVPSPRGPRLYPSPASAAVYFLCSLRSLPHTTILNFLLSWLSATLSLIS